MMILASSQVHCGTQSNTLQLQSGNGYVYEFKLSSCTTGFHEFSTIEEYCVAINDNDFNNNCANDLRAAEFKSTCEGRVFIPGQSSA